MSLTLESLLWVIPGICFLFTYHRLRDVESLEFSNWSYVFFIVLIGAVTILPVKYFLDPDSNELSITVLILSSLISLVLPFTIKLIFNPFVEKLEQEPNFFIPSFFWSLIYFFFPLENRDKFIKNCIESEGEAVLVTIDESILIKNQNKEETKHTKSIIFLGILIEFPYVATSSIDSQVIRILPLLRGYSYIENKEEKIEWINHQYDPQEDSEGLIIPRTKIINFSAYDEAQHDEIMFGKDD